MEIISLLIFLSIFSLQIKRNWIRYELRQGDVDWMSVSIAEHLLYSFSFTGGGGDRRQRGR